MHNIILYFHNMFIRPRVSSLKYRFLLERQCLYFTCIIPSLLFSDGCSGEPVRPRVSSLKYRFLLERQCLCVLYMHNIISSIF